MKKLYVLASLTMLGISASAQSGYQITTPEEALYYGGQQAMAISPNGKYIVGSSYQQQLFIYNTETKENRYFYDQHGIVTNDQGSPNLYAVSNDGLAVGYDGAGAISINFEGQYTLIEGATKEKPIVDAYDITSDGKIIIGALYTSTYYPTPVYWCDGERITLPYPSKAEAGFNVYGAYADFISEDGSVIVGRLLNGIDPYPMLIWLRQEDGSYAYTDTYKKYFEPKWQIVWGPDMLPEGIDRGPNPFIRFSPGALSGNGKYVAMTLIPNTEDINEPFQLGIYDIENDVLDVVPSREDDIIASYQNRFSIGGISDARTVVGSAGEISYNYTPFIVYYDRMQVEKLYDAFPDIEVLEEYEDINSVDMMWELATDITPDGRCIIGYIADPDNYAGLSFLLETFEVPDDPNSGIETAVADSSSEFYNLQGLKIENPEKGIFIEVKDGKASKIVR